MTKRLIIGATFLFGLVACNSGSNEYKTLKEQYDSLALVNQNYEAELHETDSLVASVLTNFQEISSVEGTIKLNPRNGDLPMSERDRIQENMLLINDRLRASSEALDQLTRKLETSGRENKRLHATISVLRKELEGQKQRILALSEELQRKNVAIGVLDSMLTERNSDVDRLNVATAKQAEALAAQEKELNTVRYCVGTSSDLKDMNLLRSGRLVTENANMSYFTKVDLRELSQIPLFSNKARLLTVHPASSYELVPGSDKQLILYIKNPAAFWSNSKILVVQVN